ncbi:MAG TPA: gliding motility lipoprotein GldB [Pricia sp.]|nr:gliding motility lipoprotein GldB [Pricia sp.]
MTVNTKMYRELLYGMKPIYVLLPMAILLSGSTLLSGCSDSEKVADEIEKINVDLKISRFDREFAKAEPLDIPILKKAYPYLFPAQYTDSIWVAKLQDSLQVELLSEVASAFPDFSEEEQDLELLFKHIKYYFPDYRVPDVVTLTSDVDYHNRIVMTDSLLLIALDNYLGPDHRFYQGFSDYIAEELNKKYLVSDVASAFAKQVVPAPKRRTFLAQMVYYGKELYLKDKLLPFISDAQKIKYSEEELAWAQANEEQIWRNFIEQEHLYSTDNKLGPRFLDPAPFSKFGLALDNESPGRIGRYVGWQIVRAFMEKNEVSLQQMLGLSAAEIFKKSKYKPEK